MIVFWHLLKVSILILYDIISLGHFLVSPNLAYLLFKSVEFASEVFSGMFEHI